jgi:hypothetical protein
MKQILTVAAALAAGFFGGLLGTQVTHIREQARPEAVVRAHRFELVDEAGQAISYWGVDKGQNLVLAFGSHWPASLPGEPAHPARYPAALDDPENQRAAIGVMEDSPFLSFRGPDGKDLLHMNLSIFAKPRLWMSDETGARLGLGVEQSDTPGPEDNNWSLSFSPERARLGMNAEKVGGQIYVHGYSASTRRG